MAAGVEVVAAVPAAVVPAAVAVPVFCSTLLGVKKFNLISKLYSKLIKLLFRSRWQLLGSKLVEITESRDGEH